MLRREYAGQGQHQEWKPVPRAAPKPKPPQNANFGIRDLPLLSSLTRSLSEQTINNIRPECPGWDVYALQHRFDEWINSDPSRKPANYEAAFQGWVRQHHSKNRSSLRESVPDTPMGAGTPDRQSIDFKGLAKIQRGIRNGVIRQAPETPRPVDNSSDFIPSNGNQEQKLGVSGTLQRGIRNVASGYRERACFASIYFFLRIYSFKTP